MSIRCKNLPDLLAPTLRKQPAPCIRYEGSLAIGMPFKFERNGRKRSTKSACAWMSTVRTQ